MSTSAILLIILILVLIGTFPTYSYSRDWGYGPVSTIGLIVIILLVLALLGVI